jgi:hypothetical protein
MKVDHVAIPIYIVSLLFIHIGYLAVFFGIFATIPTFIKYLNFGIQFILCFFLMIRFHPFREKYHLKKIDIMFIFGSAVLLFTNLVLVEMIQIPTVGTYINDVLRMFGKNTHTPTLQVSVIGNNK